MWLIGLGIIGVLLTIIALQGLIGLLGWWLLIPVGGLTLLLVHNGFKEVHQKKRWKLRLANARMAIELDLMFAAEEEETVRKEIEAEVAKSYRGAGRMLESVRKDLGLPERHITTEEALGLPLSTVARSPKAQEALGLRSPRMKNRRSHPATHA